MYSQEFRQEYSITLKKNAAVNEIDTQAEYKLTNLTTSGVTPVVSVQVVFFLPGDTQPILHSQLFYFEIA